MKPLLLDAVRALADQPAAQIAAVEPAHVDELALNLVDAQPWHDEPPPICAALDELSAVLDEMSGARNARLWTPEALDGPDWERVRKLARGVLALADP